MSGKYQGEGTSGVLQDRVDRSRGQNTVLVSAGVGYMKIREIDG
jgi:hypothetical protein